MDLKHRPQICEILSIVDVNPMSIAKALNGYENYINRNVYNFLWKLFLTDFKQMISNKRRLLQYFTTLIANTSPHRKPEINFNLSAKQTKATVLKGSDKRKQKLKFYITLLSHIYH